MTRFGRRARHVATGLTLTAITGLLAVGVRGLPADVRWALLLVITPYLPGGVLLVLLPVIGWLADASDNRVSPG